MVLSLTGETRGERLFAQVRMTVPIFFDEDGEPVWGNILPDWPAAQTPKSKRQPAAAGIDRNPMVSRKFAENPFAAKPSYSAVLLTPKWPGDGIVYAVIVDMRHSNFQTERKSEATLMIASEDGAGQAVLSVIRNSQGI